MFPIDHEWIKFEIIVYILCGRKHFEVIDAGIKYEVVKELKSLKHMQLRVKVKHGLYQK